MRLQVNREQITKVCDLKSAMRTQREVFENYYLGKAFLGPRAVLSQEENAQFAYLARASEGGPTIVKYGTVFPNNPKIGMPAVQTSILVLDARDGSVSHEFDGEAITELRTVAASMVAIDLLANPPKRVAVLGMGHQGIAHAKAIRENYQSAEIIGITHRADVAKSPRFDNVTNKSEIVQECDLIIAATSSMTPVVIEPLSPGATCISIGSFSPNRSEVSERALQAATRVIVDDVATAKQQCGAIYQYETHPKQIWSQIEGIGEVIAAKSGRSNENEVIYYFSVGLGIQDAALIELILERIS